MSLALLPLCAQAGKADAEQPSITSYLPPLDASATADVAVVGCGPAGLYLAYQLAQRGLRVALVGGLAGVCCACPPPA